MSLHAWYLALVLGLSTFACASDSPSVLGPCGKERCPEECLALSERDCDVLDPECQRRIFFATSCVRGTKGTMPTVRVVSLEDLLAEQASDAGGESAWLRPNSVHAQLSSLHMSLGTEFDAGADAAPTDEPWDAARGDTQDASTEDADALDGGVADAEEDAGPNNMPDAAAEHDAGSSAGEHEPPSAKAYWEAALSLLHLRASEPARDETNDLAGYYSSDTQSITLVDRGAAQDSEGAQKTLAHEFVHALQDQQIGLSELRYGTGRTTDAQLALGCLIEGEALLYEELAWGLLHGLSVDPTYWDVVFARQLKYARGAVLASDSPYDTVWRLRYAVGARYLADAWLSGGDWGVRSLYESPPASTVHFMHGFSARRTRSEPLTLSLVCNTATAPDGFEAKWNDTLGAMVLFAFLGHNLVDRGLYPSEHSFQQALAWRQDRLEIFGNPEGKIAVSWRIRLENEGVAMRIAAELTGREHLGLRVKQQGLELEILASDASDVLTNWTGTDHGRCP